MTLTDIAAKLGIFDTRIAALEAQNQELETSRAAVSTEADQLKAQLSTLTADLTTAKQTIGTLQATNTTLTGELKTASDALAKLKEEAPKAAATEAAKIVASAGLPHPVATENTPGTNYAQQYAALKDNKAKGEFWAAHKIEILKSI